jgi:transposase-like protein
MNHAMQIEREQVLQAESHQRTADRQGYANGFKPKTLKTRVGRVDLRIPRPAATGTRAGDRSTPGRSSEAFAANGR